MSRSDIEAGKAFVRLLLDDKQFRKGLDGALRRVDGFAKGLGSIGTKIAGLGAVFTAPFVASLKWFADAGSALKDLSTETGIAVSSLSELKYAAEQTGAGLSTIERAARFMRTQGLDPAKFDEVAARIAAIEDPTEQAAEAMAAFGKKTGQALLPMLADLDNLRTKARELGLTMSDEAAAEADALGDSLDTLGTAVKALGNGIGFALSPEIRKLADSITGSTAAATRWVSEHSGAIVMAAKLAVGMVALRLVMKGLAVIATTTTAAIRALRTALTLLARHPYLIAVTALIAALAALVEHIRRLRGAAEDSADAMDEKTTAANKLAATENTLKAAVDGTTASLDAQTEALKRLSVAERQALERKQAHEAAEKKEADAAELRRQARLQQTQETIKALRKEIARFETADLPEALRGRQLDFLKGELGGALDKRRQLQGRSNVLFSDRSDFFGTPALAGLNAAIPEAIKQAFAEAQIGQTIAMGLQAAMSPVGFAASGKITGGLAAAMEGFDTQKIQKQIFGAFTASALLAGAGGGTGDKTADEVKKADERQARRDAKLLRTIERGGVLI